MKKTILLLVVLTSFFVGNAQINSIALVGEAAGGWPGSPNDPGPIDFHQMTSTDGENWMISEIVLTNSASGGGLKFRANNEWALNWGSADFPSGIGLQNGQNIPCVAGTYGVSFNSTTGAYSFAAVDPISAIVKLVGSAINSTSGILMLTNDGVHFTQSNVDLINGNAQFEVDGNLFGGYVFPAGTLVDSVPQIPATAGNYSSITLNIATGEYNFVASPVYPLISLTGTAVGGTGDGFDFDMTTSDGIHYTYSNLGTIDGVLQFRSGHAWALNYGSTTFPEGIAALNGVAIPVPIGTWTVEFNLLTGAYTFTGTSNFPTIAIVGSGAGGWPGSAENPGPYDINQMTTTDGINYAIYALSLTNGEVKFRQNNDWTINWGDQAFPEGIATQGGNNIQSVAGTYTVQFNRITGAYSFAAVDPNSAIVKLVGSAVNSTSGILMLTNDGVNFTQSNVDLINGNAQFDVDGNLYGGYVFPAGTLVDSVPQIPVTAGHYSSITLNIATGEYNFVASPVYPLISLTGTAVGGTGDGFDFDMTTSDGIHYTYSNLGTIDGVLQFRSGHSWSLNYGSTAFPEGVATLNGAAIPVLLGTWSIEFNLSTGAYTFTGSSLFPTITIVGSGAGGWPGDIGNPGPYDINQMTTTDGINYTIFALPLTDGELKFRQNNDWTINWGDIAFPSGIATQGGANIVTIAGTYTVQFNRITGAYTFGNPNRIAIVGSGAGGWPTGTVGEIDTNQLTSSDGITFRLNNITLTDGFVKFRQNNSWDVNWGGTSFFGTLVLNGPDIPTTAGTYSVAMNRVTGAYAFAEPLGTTAFHASNFKVYPNPSNSVWNFASTANKNIVSIQIVDVLGKTVLAINPAATSASVDASSLNSGLYFAKIATVNATETIKLMKN